MHGSKYDYMSKSGPLNAIVGWFFNKTRKHKHSVMEVKQRDNFVTETRKITQSVWKYSRKAVTFVLCQCNSQNR